MRPLDTLHFDDRFVRTLPGDASGVNTSRELRDVAYSLVQPTPVSAPRLLAWSEALAVEMGIARPAASDDASVQILAGNHLASGMRPYAARYGGHQFGHWAGQLGDGRAITLGEWVNARGMRYELQLKGAGPTPYSRRADGRAVLRSSLREFLCSEAMHHLGVPTTRALSLVATGDEVLRDMLYDGNARNEPGAIVCRVAPTFLRFGNFEILAAHAEIDLMRSLLDDLINTQYPELAPARPQVYAAWFEGLCRRTALMLAHWMRVGFVHGVMNTDNMSVLGLTIDYGPYGWLEGFDANWTPNTTDAGGRRYAFGRQPQIALWNLSRLAGALAPLIERDALEAGLDAYRSAYDQHHREMYAGKLGLSSLVDVDSERLLDDLLSLLGSVETDYTIFFRRLAQVNVDADQCTDDGALLRPLDAAFYNAEGRQSAHQARLAQWVLRYQRCVQSQGVAAQTRIARMNAHNPKYVPRNYLAQLAIDAAEQGDNSVLERLLDVLRRAYDEQPEHEELAARRPEWARNRVGCSALSCSS
ncbi:MAG: YdiU family protein [Pseudomonadota bacterium]|nr:YdiU family protein [Pseudomonadota bacterium]